MSWMDMLKDWGKKPAPKPAPIVINEISEPVDHEPVDHEPVDHEPVTEIRGDIEMDVDVALQESDTKVFLHPRCNIHAAHQVDVNNNSKQGGVLPHFIVAYCANMVSNMAHRLYNRSIGFLYNLHATGPSFDNAALRSFALIDYDADNDPTDEDLHCDMDVVTYSSTVKGSAKRTYHGVIEGVLAVESTCGGGSSSCGQHRIKVHDTASDRWSHFGEVFTVYGGGQYDKFRGEKCVLARGKWKNLIAVQKRNIGKKDPANMCMGPRANFSGPAIDLEGAEYSTNACAIKLNDNGTGAKIVWGDNKASVYFENGKLVLDGDVVVKGKLTSRGA